ncbi:HepT-like ribonuclease domain-containing protein [Streptomyces sp. NPDC058001]|uniref:HepT-like ribonuclease domain-containing protein n=1 Tax=Streptomyces sp. NPDC058001 TaxID=3346300 RepID=UPI0036EE194A
MIASRDPFPGGGAARHLLFVTTTDRNNSPVRRQRVPPAVPPGGIQGGIRGKLCQDAEVTTSKSVALDKDVIEHRLITMRKSIGQLESAGRLSVARLDENPATGAAVERLLAILDELAFAINRHVASVILGQVPQTSAASFGAAREAGLLDERLATALVPEEGPHNVLVQLHLDSEPEAIEAIMSDAISGYREYARQVTEWAGSRS